MLIFRQLQDPASNTFTYLLGDAESGQALLIDPVFEHVRRDMALLRELGLKLIATVETHVHADHVTAAWLLKQRCASVINVPAHSGASGAGRLLQHGDKVVFGQRWLQARSTPGHTAGCTSYVMDDRSMVFTGDCLLIRGCGRTDFQQGSAPALFRSVHEQLFSLPPQCLVYPGHDYRGLSLSTVAEERRFNPRLGGDASEADFAGYMQHLGLARPKLMDVAVPANLRCGQPSDGAAPPTEPSWAALTYSYSGIWEMEPSTLEDRLAQVQLVDVRELDEFSQGLGRIAGALRIPLADLAARSKELDADRPVVTICRSGTRSAQAAALLQRDGFAQVANLAGGMLRWCAEGQPVVNAAD